jgi:ADP-ribose pyrophosphatase
MEVHRTRVNFGTYYKDYFVIELGPRAGIVAANAGRVLLTGQYRFLIDRVSWELPGGRVDAGESAETAAVRECMEETGVQCSGLRKLVEYYPGLDNFNNRTTVFLSADTIAARPFKAVEEEVAEIRWFPIAAVMQMISSGEILDALTITGLLAFASSRLLPPGGS